MHKVGTTASDTFIIEMTRDEWKDVIAISENAWRIEFVEIFAAWQRQTPVGNKTRKRLCQQLSWRIQYEQQWAYTRDAFLVGGRLPAFEQWRSEVLSGSMDRKLTSIKNFGPAYLGELKIKLQETLDGAEDIYNVV